jgi:hypothetical protein
VLGDMGATYRITFSETYCRTTIDRYQRQRPIFMRPNVQIPLQPIGFAVAFIVASRFASELQWFYVWLFGIICVASAIEWFYLRKAPLRRLLRHAGATATYVLSIDAIEMESPLGQAKVQWATYPRAVRFTDGVMLLRRGVICWLPDSLLEGSTPGEVIALVQSKTSLRYVA